MKRRLTALALLLALLLSSGLTAAAAPPAPGRSAPPADASVRLPPLGAHYFSYDYYGYYDYEDRDMKELSDAIDRALLVLCGAVFSGYILSCFGQLLLILWLYFKRERDLRNGT